MKWKRAFKVSSTISISNLKKQTIDPNLFSIYRRNSILGAAMGCITNQFAGNFKYFLRYWTVSCSFWKRKSSSNYLVFNGCHRTLLLGCQCLWLPKYIQIHHQVEALSKLTSAPILSLCSFSMCGSRRTLHSYDLCIYF